MSIYIVESNPERAESCGFCPAANSECPALVPLDECLPGNPAANDCATDDCIYGCKPDDDLGIAERAWYAIGTICEFEPAHKSSSQSRRLRIGAHRTHWLISHRVKTHKGMGECNTDRGLNNCLGT